jgi:hypothetical protein
MSWEEYFSTHKEQTAEQAFNDGYHMGFLKAIELLRNPDRYQTDIIGTIPPVYSCVHSNEWATWLESKVTESLHENKA